MNTLFDYGIESEVLNFLRDNINEHIEMIINKTNIVYHLNDAKFLSLYSNKSSKWVEYSFDKESNRENTVLLSSKKKLKNKFEIIEDLVPFIENFRISLEINTIPEFSFGCCSRYVQCSDEKMCVQPDKEFAKGCHYKINLENNRIFYGKNKNI